METKADTIASIRAYMAARLHIAGRNELLTQGFSWTRIRSWVRQGRLVAVLRGVYSYGRDIETAESAYRAALVAAGPDSALSGRSACEVWGITKSREPIPRQIEVARPTGKAAKFRGISPVMRRVLVKVTRRAFTSGEVRQKNGLRLICPPLALIDLAANATATEVKFAFLEACRLGLFVRADVGYCFSRMVRRRGATKLRSLLKLWVPELGRIRSVLEGMFLLAWLEAGYAVPRVNEKVHGFEVDFYWPAQGVIVELDGKAFHSDPIARMRDAARDRALRDLGLLVIRISYEEMKNDPKAVVARIAAILAERS